MRICLVNSIYAPDAVGGAEKSVQLLAESLNRLGHEVLVIVTGRSSSTRNINDVPVHQISIANLYWPFDSESNARLAAKAIWHVIDSVNPIMGRRIERLIAEFRPDVVHTNNIAGFSVSVWGAVKRLDLPLVHTLRDYYLLCPKATMFRNGSNCTGRCAGCAILTFPRKYLCDKVDHVVSISQSVLELHQYHGYFRRTKSAVIHNPHDGVMADRVVSTSHRSGVRVGFMGRLAPSKGLEFLLEAVRRLAGTNDHFELIIAGVGEPSYVEYLKHQAPIVQVEFLGYVPANQFYEQVDVVVVPSLWREPLGRVALEASAHGLPVIASRNGGLVEVVNNGVTGWLYDSANVDELVEILRRVLIDPESLVRMKCACIEWASHFTPILVAQQYIQIYRNVQSVIPSHDGSPTSGAGCSPI